MNKKEKINPFIEIDENLFLEGEELKPVTDNSIKGVCPYYYVSNYGNVFSFFKDKPIKLTQKKEFRKDGDNEYLTVNISARTEDGENINKKVKVHRIVASEFKPNDRDIENGIDFVDHIDGRKDNNNINNLDWVSRQENVDRAMRNGLLNRQLEDAKMLIGFIVEDLKENKLTQDQLSKKYGVSRSTINRIKHGSYRDIVGSDIEFTFKQPLTDEQLKDIYIRSFTDEDWQKIADEYNISWYTVKQIHYPNANRFGDRIRAMGFDNISVADNLTEDQIIEIRKKSDMGISDEVLAKEYNRSTRTISMIRKGRDRFKETLENAGFVSDDPERELNDGEMLQIYEMAKNGISDKEIAEKFNVHQTTVINIRTGSKYKQAEFLRRYNLPKIMLHNRKIVKENRFSEEEAIAIYNEMKETKKYTRQMAAKYGCDKSLMANIKYCRGPYYYLQEKYGLEPLNY